ncbi:MAG: hypothetical protein B7Z77_10780 [Acidocella sp. 20-58-15]|nr:MAG: hypothetical protein B7Z77_10780 [Acidocella sp. 20-58-15]
MAYWRYQDYAGIGPGAHGRITLNGQLWATQRHRAPEAWADLVEAKGSGATTEEVVSQADQAREALLMGLRLAEGIEAAEFERRTGLALVDALEPDVLQAAREEGYLEMSDTQLVATLEGRKRLDALLPVLVR